MMRNLRLGVMVVTLATMAALTAAGACGNLTGSWKCEGKNCANNGKLAKVIQDENEITFINERGSESSGQFVSEFKVLAYSWIHNGKPLEGILLEDENCRKIHWKNGSTWIRQ